MKNLFIMLLLRSKQLKKRIISFIFVVTLLVLLDQVSKYFIKKYFFPFTNITIIKGFFNLIYVKNKGVAFGLLSNLPFIFKKIFLIWIPSFACLALIFYILFAKKISKKAIIGYTLIIAGAIGNLIDRICYGYVVDFFDLYYKNYHWPAFNFADSYITIGIILIAFEIIFHK